MYETYRMLGREHEADLEREAGRRALGALVRARLPLTKRTQASLRGFVARVTTASGATLNRPFLRSLRK